MSRIIKNSHPGERVLFSTRPRFSQSVTSAYLRLIILFLLLYFFTTIIRYFAAIQAQITTLLTIPFVEWSTDVLLVIIALLFLSLIWTYLSWRSTCYILTNKRVMIKSGVISKKNVYMHFNKIQDVTVSQGFTQRISSAGDIEIFGGRDRTSLILENIPNPDKFETLLNEKIENIPQDYDNKQPKDLRDERYQ
jgi:membrane protein YdbS with pleckstrin-like domain